MFGPYSSFVQFTLPSGHFWNIRPHQSQDIIELSDIFRKQLHWSTRIRWLLAYSFDSTNIVSDVGNIILDETSTHQEIFEVLRQLPDDLIVLMYERYQEVNNAVQPIQ